MRLGLFISVLAVGLATVSCTDDVATEVMEEYTLETMPLVQPEEYNYRLDVEKSVANWRGYLANVYTHEGNMYFTDGALLVSDNHIDLGAFILDMRSMLTTDSDENYEYGSREDLLEHLESEEFFDVEHYPQAWFEVLESGGETIMGLLTVKGKRIEAEIKDVSVFAKEGELIASGMLVINRQDFGITYSNKINDMLISDEIIVDFTLYATIIKE